MSKKIKNFTWKKSDYIVCIFLCALIGFSVCINKAKAKIQIAQVCIASVYNLPGENPNIEGIELYVEESGSLVDYKLVSSESKNILALPCMNVDEGQSFVVFTGRGETNCNRVYLGLKNEVLEEEGGTILLYRGSELVGEYNY